MGVFSSGKSKGKSGGLVFGGSSVRNEEEQLQGRIGNYETRFSAIGAKPPEPKKESNFLLKALDILDRPRNAILSGLTGQGFTKGLTGKTKVNVSDLLKDKVDNKYLRGGLGFVGDVLLDPLTYLTVGTAGVAKSAAQQGAKKYLKFAGQPLADVTGVGKAIGRGFERTGIPEMIGPILSTKRIRRAVTSEDELPDIANARDAITNTQRLIKGQQQEALDRYRDIFKGVNPQAAAQAAHIIESPTLMRNNLPGTSIKQKVTVKRPGKAGVLDDMITNPATPRQANRPPFNDAVSLPNIEGMKGVSPTLRVAGLKMEGNAVAPATLPKEVPPQIRDLNIPKDKNLQVGFENKPIQTDQLPKTTTTEEMFEAARKSGISMNAESKAAARIAKQLTEQTARKDIEAGVEFAEVPNYVRHLYKGDLQKTQKILNKWMKDKARVPGKKAGFQKERTLPTLAEAKRLGLEPIEDVRILTAVRELEGIQQRGIQSMYRELEKIGQNVVRDIKDAPTGWKQLPGIKHLEGKAVHPETARFLERFNSTVNTDEGMRTFLSTLRGVQNFWKGLVTAPNPAFHIRNAMGNVFNNFLAGVVNPNVYRLAGIVQKGGSEIVTLNGQQYTAKELRKIFRENGLEGFGFFAGETSKSMLREATEAFGKQSLKDKFNPIQAGRKIGDKVETNAKMAHFIDRLNKGDSAKDAAESVRKYLFDYGDLTQAEKKIRDLIPFYTFTRKNLPLQLENLITNPGKMTAVNKLMENAKSSQGTQEGDMPGWMKSELAIPLGNNKSLMLDLPMNQLNMIGGGETLKNALGMISPLAKVPIELAMGRQIFSGAPIEKYPGATARFGNLPLPANVAYGLSQLGPMPRTAADIAGNFIDQQPSKGAIPPPPKQIPMLGSFIRQTNPERERLLGLTQREQQLADYRRYIEEVLGGEVPTLAEIEKKKKKGRVF